MVHERAWSENGFVFEKQKEPSVLEGHGLQGEEPETRAEWAGVHKLEQRWGPESKCYGKHLSYVLPASFQLLWGEMDCKEGTTVEVRRLGGDCCNHPGER